MFEDLLSDLRKIGLEEKLGRVYLTLLSRPGARVQEVAEASGLPRASCYDLLADLVERGFVEIGEGDFGRRYFPRSPEFLLSFLHLEEQKLSERRQIAERILPTLTVLYNPSGPQPRVRYKEGLHGLRELQREYEVLEDDILQIIGFDAFLALHDPGVTDEHRRGLVAQAKRMRAIIVTSVPYRVPDIPGLEVRILPPELFSVEGEMTLCGERVTFFSYAEDMVAIEVRSPAIAGTCRAVLELAWKQAGDISSFC